MSTTTPTAVRDFIFRFNDRMKVKDGSLATSVELLLTLEDARLFYAAMKWMEVMSQSSTIQQTDIPFRDCLAFIKAKAEELKNQKHEDKILRFNIHGIRALREIEKHLDQFAMLMEFDTGNKRRGKKRQ